MCSLVCRFLEAHVIAIANVSKNWAIGKQGKLLCTIPEDMQRFRSLTMGNVVIMGNSTLKSLPGKLPLEGRFNIVLIGRDDSCAPESVNGSHEKKIPLVFAHSVEQALDFVSGFRDDDVFVVGGASIYKQFLPYCSECWLTENSIDDPDADAFFPDISNDAAWVEKSSTAMEHYGDIDYRFVEYERRK